MDDPSVTHSYPAIGALQECVNRTRKYPLRDWNISCVDRGGGIVDPPCENRTANPNATHHPLRPRSWLCEPARYYSCTWLPEPCGPPPPNAAR